MTRTCGRCGVQYPATRDHFDRNPRDIDGLTLWCIACREQRGLRTPRGSRTSTPVGTFDRAFGVEFEFIGDRYAVASALRAAGIPVEVEGYNHRDRRDGTWKIVTDGSVPRGGELVSPVLQGAAGFETMRRVLDVLSGAAKVDRTCGTHVHLDARRESVESIKRFTAAYVNRQDSIDMLVSPSRRRGGGNGYCRTWTVYDLENLQNVNDLATLRRRFRGESYMRYRTVNVNAFSRHGTVEIRQHQGTLNASKVTAWVRFLMALWTVDATTASTDTYTMLDEVGELDGETREYLKSRAYAFRSGVRA